jgi:hypothetical protein
MHDVASLETMPFEHVVHVPPATALKLGTGQTLHV